MALERAYSDLPEKGSDERTIDNLDLVPVGESGSGNSGQPPPIDLTALEAWSNLGSRFDDFATRSLDVVFSLSVLVLGAPVFALIWLVIRISSPGRAIYRHKRVGRNGELFECLKFRTMVEDADSVLEELFASNPGLKEEFDHNHKLKDDPRITPVGHFLRRTSLDELPQFWNVLKGEMSVVGPRPIVEEEAVRFGADLPIVLSTRPGITGLWQISGRNDLTYDQRVALDREYALTRSLLKNIGIMARTPAAALKRDNGAY